MITKSQWLLSLAQCVLILVGGALFLLSGVIPVNLGWSIPWYFSLIFLLGAGVCGFYALWLSDEAEKRRALAHMAERSALGEVEFGERYFPTGRAEIAAKLRSILARHIPVDLSRMHPGDRFVDDLRMDALDSMAIVEFVIEVEKEFEITIPDAAAEKMLTFQSVVDYIAEATKAKPASAALIAQGGRIQAKKVRPVFRILAAALCVTALAVLGASFLTQGIAAWKFQAAGMFLTGLFLYVAITGRGPRWVR